MANRYWVGGTGTWDGSATTHWSATDGGASGASVPTTNDDVFFTALSGGGTVTLQSSAVSRAKNLDCTGFTGTLNGGGVVNGSITLGSGMALTTGTSAWSLTGTGTHTITSNGKSFANSISITAVTGSYTVTDAFSIGTLTLTLTSGTLDTNNQACTWGVFSSSNSNSRTLTLGSSNINITGTSGSSWTCSTATNMTLNAGTSTITFSDPTGSGINSGINLTYNNIISTGDSFSFTSSGGMGTGSFTNFTRTGSAVLGNSFILNTTMVVTGTTTITGFNSTTNRLVVKSNTPGSRRLINTANVSIANVDFTDIQGGGAANWDLSAITGGSGDGGNNSGIIFTTAAPQSWQTTLGGNWSNAANWTSRVPLPQDNVTVSQAFTPAQTITLDMRLLGKDINFTGTTGNPALSFVNSASVFGNWTGAAGMTTTGSSTLAFEGRDANYTITSAGVTYACPVSITTEPTSAYTLLDALTCQATFTVSSGTFVANGNTLTCDNFAFPTTTNTKTINISNSTVALTSTAAVTVWNGTATLTTFTATNSNIVIATASSNTRTFTGGGLTYGALTYTVAGSTGRLTISDANTFGSINFSDASNARTLRFPLGTTTTITGVFNVQGTAGKLMSIDTATAGSFATLSKSSGIVNCDYLSVKDSHATGGAVWYAGSHSTSVSGNTGWIFNDPQPQGWGILM